MLDVRLKDLMAEVGDEKAQGRGLSQAARRLHRRVGRRRRRHHGRQFKAVTTRFYNVVVRADVGIIDVAWALKDSSTRNTNRLVAERKRELKLLDDEFKEV